MASERSGGATPVNGLGTTEPVEQPPRHHDTPELVRHEPAVRQEIERTPVEVNVAGERRDLIRWGPVWAGLLVALPVFILVELVFFALGWLSLDPGANESGSSAGWISGLIGLFAFFLGGAVAGATAMWRTATGGMLHGVLVWALGVVTFLFLTLFGGGSLFGALGDVAGQVINLERAVNVPDLEVQTAVSAARSASGWAVLGLGVSLAAAAIGGMVGAKMWPRKQEADGRHTAE